MYSTNLHQIFGIGIIIGGDDNLICISSSNCYTSYFFEESNEHRLITAAMMPLH